MATEGKQDWRDRPRIPESKTSGLDIRSLDGRTVGSTVRKSPFNTNTLNTFFTGILEADISGATLNGSPLNTYIVQIFLNHNFSQVFPDLTPLYFFWRQYGTEGDGSIRIFFADQGNLAPSGGTFTASAYNVMHRGDQAPAESVGSDTDEYLMFNWTVARSAGTTTVAADTIRMIPAIVYFSQPLETIPVGAQGGGGGILIESFNFYTYEA